MSIFKIFTMNDNIDNARELELFTAEEIESFAGDLDCTHSEKLLLDLVVFYRKKLEAKWKQADWGKERNEINNNFLDYCFRVDEYDFIRMIHMDKRPIEFIDIVIQQMYSVFNQAKLISKSELVDAKPFFSTVDWDLPIMMTFDRFAFINSKMSIPIVEIGNEKYFITVDAIIKYFLKHQTAIRKGYKFNYEGCTVTFVSES